MNEQMPDGLELAVAHIEELGSIIAARYADHTEKVRPSRLDRVGREVETCNAAIEAIRAEHAQRLTLQHHAADQAQRIAELEAERDKAHQDTISAAVERDELRARLAELEGQESVAWIEHEWSGSGQQYLHFSRRKEGIRDEVVCPTWTALYARPVPAHAAPDPVALLKSLGPKPWETSPEAHAQARLIYNFADALAAAPEAAREKYNVMRQALEVIAVGDSIAPASDAADTLVTVEEWQASSLAAARADGAMPTGPRQSMRLSDEQIGKALLASVGEPELEIDFALWAQHPDGAEFVALSRAIENRRARGNGLYDEVTV